MKILLNIGSGPTDNSSWIVAGSQREQKAMFERAEVKVGQVYQETDRLKGKWRVEAYVRVPGLGPHVRLCSLDDRSKKRTLSTIAVGDTKRFHPLAAGDVAWVPDLMGQGSLVAKAQA